MHLKTPCLVGLAALVAGGLSVTALHAQTAPQSAQRTPARTAQRAPAAGTAPASGAAPAPAARIAPAPRTADAGARQGAPAKTPTVTVPSQSRGAAGAPQPNAGQAQPGQQQPGQQLTPKGFELTEEQQRLLDLILKKWEQSSDKVNTFTCTFARWEYDPAWAPVENESLKGTGSGQIKYKSPDRGEYLIEKLEEWDAGKRKYTAKTEGLDHWVCDGKAIYEFNSTKKQLIERRLPPEMQGKAISDGPLPFIFGAKAEQLKRRYWMKDVTPKDDVGKKVWLEAIPKFQQDRLNFARATVILNEADFMPEALQIFLPDGKSNTAYQFANSKVNSLLGTWTFTAPKLSPLMMAKGWKHVVEEDPSAAEAETAEAAPAGKTPEPAQAKRGAAATQRK